MRYNVAMLRVVHGDNTLALAQSLVQVLPGDVSPFAPVTIVVGHRVVGQWLRRFLARERGIAAGIHCVSFEHWAAQHYVAPLVAAAEAEAAVNGGFAAPYLVGRRGLAIALASVTTQLRAASAALAPVAAYLGPAPADERRVQFADRLADLYWTYALSRPQWLRMWQDGHMPQELAGNQTAQWQAALYRAALHELGPQAVLVPAVHQLGQRHARVVGRRALGPVQVFGFSYLQAAQLEALRDAAMRTDVWVYQFDPCEAFWIDRNDTEELPPLLGHWGRPTRETLAALIDAAAGDVADAFAERAQVGVLGALWYDMRARQAPSISPETARELTMDVTVLAAPSVRRELEAVGLRIAALCAADPSLALTDIAVLIAGADAERYFLQAPFALERIGGVPFHLVDAPVAQNGTLIDALLAILDLPTSDFARADMLRVMTHPAVLAAFPGVEAADWVELADQLGVAHGRNSEDAEGGYLEQTPYFHWDHAVRRLALGCFATGVERGRPPLRVGHTAYAPFELDGEARPRAAAFALLARSLIADAAWLAAQRFSLMEWSAALLQLVEAYLASAPNERELAALRTMLAAIGELGAGAATELGVPTVTRDLASTAVAAAQVAHRDVAAPPADTVPHAFARQLSFAELRAWVQRWFGSARAGRGELLSSGVMIAPLGAMRALPFRHVVICGLGEATFPAPERLAALDLREVRANDVSARDRDRVAFFEALANASESVTCAYVASDEQTGEPLGPSPVLLELCDALAPYVAAPSAETALASLSTRVSMFGFRCAAATPAPHSSVGCDEAPAPAVPEPGMARAVWADSVRAELRTEFRHAGLPFPTEGNLAGALVAAQPDVAEILAMRTDRDVHAAPRAPVGGQGAATDGHETVVRLTALRQFLENPVQAWARAALELRDDESEEDVDAAQRVHEPFALGNKELAMPLRRVLEQHLRQGGDLTERYRAMVHEAQLVCQHPVGVFADALAERNLATLHRWRQEIGPVAVSATSASVRRFSFGNSVFADVELLTPLSIETEVAGQPRTVRIVGTTEMLVRGHGSIILRLGDYSKADHLRAMLDHVVLSACEVLSPDAAHPYRIIARDRVETASLLPWQPADARAYLAELAADLLGATHAYLLTFEQLVAVAANKRPRRSSARDLGFGPVQSDAGLRHSDDIADELPVFFANRLAPLWAKLPADHPLRGQKRGAK